MARDVPECGVTSGDAAENVGGAGAWGGGGYAGDPPSGYFLGGGVRAGLLEVFFFEGVLSRIPLFADDALHFLIKSYPFNETSPAGRGRMQSLF